MKYVFEKTTRTQKYTFEYPKMKQWNGYLTRKGPVLQSECSTRPYNYVNCYLTRRFFVNCFSKKLRS